MGSSLATKDLLFQLFLGSKVCPKQTQSGSFVSHLLTCHFLSTVHALTCIKRALTIDPMVHLYGFSNVTTGPMCPAFYRLVPVKSGRLNRRGAHGSFVLNDWQVFLWLHGRNN